ncbi:uncharacterized protein L199_007378 [Kwoniella botswanensis]|uniref:uncharacterized protein n=1 Tax=Kwoniella botswanensis TaxID=1268659 RepID=UPI00315DBB0D
MKFALVALVASAAVAAATPNLLAREYGDCRDTEGSCPGGSCVSSDSSNADAGYICSFPDASSTTSESSAASSTASSSSGSYGDCRDTEGSCPGGSCVSSDSSNSDAGYICSFDSSSASSTSSAAATTSAKATTNTGTAPTTLSAAATSAKASTTSKAASTTALASNATTSASNSTTASTSSNSSSGAGLSSTVNYAVAGLFAAGLYVAL